VSYLHLCLIYLYNCIYIERERGREREGEIDKTDKNALLYDIIIIVFTKKTGQ